MDEQYSFSLGNTLSGDRSNTTLPVMLEILIPLEFFDCYLVMSIVKCFIVHYPIKGWVGGLVERLVNIDLIAN